MSCKRGSNSSSFRTWNFARNPLSKRYQTITCVLTNPKLPQMYIKLLRRTILDQMQQRFQTIKDLHNLVDSHNQNCLRCHFKLAWEKWIVNVIQYRKKNYFLPHIFFSTKIGFWKKISQILERTSGKLGKYYIKLQSYPISKIKFSNFTKK